MCYSGSYYGGLGYSYSGCGCDYGCGYGGSGYGCCCPLCCRRYWTCGFY
ncbi:keratin-associated protein 20-2-like [Cavia porcellus]|nr:keratin-associated protein 20-2-like [Cavia porcellus]